MSNKTKLEVSQREIRTKLSTLAGKESLTDEERTEINTLTKEIIDNDSKLNALTIAEPESSSTQGDTLSTLESRSTMGRVVDAVINHRIVDGAEKELQAHYKLEANQIPLSMLRQETRETENRASVTVPGDVGANQQETLQPVFASSVAAFLGVDMPTVGVGESVYPVLTNRPTVGGPHDDSTTVAAGTGTFTAEVLSPERIQASYAYRRVDAAKFANMDMALRQALSSALSEKMDYEVLRGTNGLLAGTNLSAHNVTSQDTFQTYCDRFGYGRVDGRFADDISMVRSVVGTSTYSHMARQYVGSGGNVDAFSVLDKLAQRSGGVRVSAHVAAPSGNRQQNVIRLGMRRDMVAPVWEGISLLADEITKAGEGELIITAMMLYAVKIIRPAGFFKQQSQLA